MNIIETLLMRKINWHILLLFIIQNASISSVHSKEVDYNITQVEIVVRGYSNVHVIQFSPEDNKILSAQEMYRITKSIAYSTFPADVVLWTGSIALKAGENNRRLAELVENIPDVFYSGGVDLVENIVVIESKSSKTYTVWLELGIYASAISGMLQSVTILSNADTLEWHPDPVAYKILSKNALLKGYSRDEVKTAFRSLVQDLFDQLNILRMENP